MIDLHVHKVFWCAHHGHPALTLRVAGSDRRLIVALGNEDALALAAAHMPGPSSTSRPDGLLAEMVQALGEPAGA